jgi:hypothetical protein
LAGAIAVAAVALAGMSVALYLTRDWNKLPVAPPTGLSPAIASGGKV